MSVSVSSRRVRSSRSWNKARASCQCSQAVVRSPAARASSASASRRGPAPAGRAHGLAEILRCGIRVPLRDLGLRGRQTEVREGGLIVLRRGTADTHGPVVRRCVIAERADGCWRCGCPGRNGAGRFGPRLRSRAGCPGAAVQACDYDEEDGDRRQQDEGCRETADLDEAKGAQYPGCDGRDHLAALPLLLPRVLRVTAADLRKATRRATKDC